MGLDGFDRKSFRVNLDHSLAADLEVSVSAFYSNSTSDGNPAEGANNAPNPLFGLMFLERDNDLLAPNADGTPFNIRPDPNALEENPLYATHNVEFDKRRRRTLGNMRVRWFPVTGGGWEAGGARYLRPRRSKRRQAIERHPANIGPLPLI